MNLTKKIFSPNKETKILINPEENEALHTFIFTLSSILNNVPRQTSEFIILCIGSDRSTGDALGPFVGSMLENNLTNSVKIMGTLSEPVHALNLEQKLANIEVNFFSPIILAVDASLGKKSNIGFVELGNGGLKPGAAVKKELPFVGNLYITGIVNVGGFMDFMVLQSTRLNLVFNLARFISRGITCTLDNVSWLAHP